MLQGRKRRLKDLAEIVKEAPFEPREFAGSMNKVAEENGLRCETSRSAVFLVGGSRMKVVIFCGGLGLRLREYSENVPKPLVPIGDAPVMWHLMKYYSHYGHNDFILCLGHKGEAIKRFFLNYNEALSQRLHPFRTAGVVLSSWALTSATGESHSQIRGQVSDR